ncbi:MAG: hypothetical protein ACYC7A_03600 [Thermoanaerobaculia bacterium]
MLELLGFASIFLIFALLAVPLLAAAAAAKIGFALFTLPFKLLFIVLKLASGLVVFSIALAFCVPFLILVALFVAPVLFLGVFIFGSVKLLQPA